MLTWKIPALAGLAVAGLLLAGSDAATAVTITYDGTTATMIEDLDVGGVLYDVDFVETTSLALYGGTFPLDEAGAQAAAAAINTALNDENIATTVGPTSADGAILYGIGYDLSGTGALTFTKGGSFLGGTNWNDISDSFTTTDTRVYADLTVVPEPATALLLALGIVGLGFRRRTARG